MRLGNGSGGLIFDQEGGAYQSVRWPSWWSASGPPAESGLAIVAEIGSGKGGQNAARSRERWSANEISDSAWEAALQSQPDRSPEVRKIAALDGLRK